MTILNEILLYAFMSLGPVAVAFVFRGEIGRAILQVGVIVKQKDEMRDREIHRTLTITKPEYFGIDAETEPPTHQATKAYTNTQLSPSMKQFISEVTTILKQHTEDINLIKEALKIQ